MKEENYTNEKLVKKFTSPFNLVTYAAELAKSISLHGEDRSNLANYVLDLIREGKDQIVEEEVKEEKKEMKEEQQRKA